MCGRYVVARASADLVPLFEIEHVSETLPEPSFNISPPGPISIVLESAREGAEGRRLEAARWGLVPAYAKGVGQGPNPTNARVENLASSGMYRRSFQRRRALIPADGFYEWHDINGRKQPFFAADPEGDVLALAGLYEWWKNRAVADDDPARWVLSATIIVQPAEGPLAEIHHGMPLLIPAELQADWLDPQRELAEAELTHLRRLGADLAQTLAVHPVSTAVNSTRVGQRRDEASLIDPIAP